MWLPASIEAQGLEHVQLMLNVHRGGNCVVWMVGDIVLGIAI